MVRYVICIYLPLMLSIFNVLPLVLIKFPCVYMALMALMHFPNVLGLNCIANLFIVFETFSYISMDCNAFYLYFLRVVMYLLWDVLWILMFGPCIFNILIIVKALFMYVYKYYLILQHYYGEVMHVLCKPLEF